MLAKLCLMCFWFRLFSLCFSFYSSQQLLSFSMPFSFIFQFFFTFLCFSLYRARLFQQLNFEKVRVMWLFMQVLFTLKFKLYRVWCILHSKARYLWALSIKLLVVFIYKRYFSRRQARVYFVSSSFLFRLCNTTMSCLSSGMCLLFLYRCRQLDKVV